MVFGALMRYIIKIISKCLLFTLFVLFSFVTNEVDVTVIVFVASGIISPYGDLPCVAEL